MVDYHCFPLWELLGDGLHNVDPEKLDISTELRVALSNWASSYDRTLNQEYPPDSGFATPTDEEAFEAEGLRLWKQLQAELGADVQVVYRSQRTGETNA
jgi:hypothetical protein